MEIRGQQIVGTQMSRYQVVIKEVMMNKPEYMGWGFLKTLMDKVG